MIGHPNHHLIHVLISNPNVFTEQQKQKVLALLFQYFQTGLDLYLALSENVIYIVKSAIKINWTKPPPEVWSYQHTRLTLTYCSSTIKWPGRLKWTTSICDFFKNWTLLDMCWGRCTDRGGGRRTCSCGPCRCWDRPPPEFAGRATPSGSVAVYSAPCGPRACLARTVPTSSTSPSAIPAAPSSNVLTASSPKAAWPLWGREIKQQKQDIKVKMQMNYSAK